MISLFTLDSTLNKLFSFSVAAVVKGHTKTERTSIPGKKTFLLVFVYCLCSSFAF